MSSLQQSRSNLQGTPDTGAYATRSRTSQRDRRGLGVTSNQPAAGALGATEIGGGAAQEAEDSERIEERGDSEEDSINGQGSDAAAEVWTEDWAKENAERLAYLSPHQPLWVARRQQSREKQSRIVSCSLGTASNGH